MHATRSGDSELTGAKDETDQTWRRPAAAGRRRLVFVRSGSEAGVDAGGCSATRAVARCACRSRRIGPPASTSTTPATSPKQGRRPIRPERPTVDDAAEPEIGEQQVATWSQARPCICADAGTMATSGLIGVLSHRLPCGHRQQPDTRAPTGRANLCTPTITAKTTDVASRTSDAIAAAAGSRHHQSHEVAGAAETAEDNIHLGRAQHRPGRGQAPLSNVGALRAVTCGVQLCAIQTSHASLVVF